MGKIHNNLIIENLIKTEWINQFNKYQQEEIIKGIEDNLDVFIYAKREFDWGQMLYLRLGLKDNLDVSIYAKKEFNRDQMDQIRLGLKANLDVSIYAKSEISWREMEQIKERLLEAKRTL